MQATFSTARLLLSLITEDDYDFIEQLVNTKGWIEFIGDRNIHSKEDAIKYISKIKNLSNFILLGCKNQTGLYINWHHIIFKT